MTVTDSPPDSGAPDADPPGSDASAPDTGRAGRRRAMLVLGALCVLLAAAAIVLGVLLRQHLVRDEAREDALRAARQSALNLTSIDYEDFDTAVERVLEGATGEFGEEFQENADNLRQLLLDNEVKSQGKIVEAGVVRADASSATVLVVVDSTVRNTETPEGRVNTNRMQIEVEKVDGRWRTSTLQFVG